MQICTKHKADLRQENIQIQYKLGTGITRIILFYRILDEPIITNKLIIIMAVIAVIKVIILFTWR